MQYQANYLASVSSKRVKSEGYYRIMPVLVIPLKSVLVSVPRKTYQRCERSSLQMTQKGILETTKIVRVTWQSDFIQLSKCNFIYT